MTNIIDIYKHVITSLVNHTEVNIEEIENALLFASKRLDCAVVNNLTTEEIERDRDDLQWLLTNV